MMNEEPDDDYSSSEPDKQERVFRQEKKEQNEAMISLIVFGIIGLGFIYGMWLIAPAETPPSSLVCFGVY